MKENHAFVVGLVLGAVMLASVCFVYIKHQKFGIGGATLSGLAVILVGMSVWPTIKFGFDGQRFWAELEQAQQVARQASKDAEEAKKETMNTRQAVTSLKTTLTTVIAQEKLKAANLYSGASDGQLSPGMITALKKLQASQGLGRSGELDEPTKNALGIRLSPGASN